MVQGDKFWVLEFNARFGDPEAQALLPRMVDDLYPWCEAIARGDMSKMPDRVNFIPEAAVVVVAASGGYPDNPEKGHVINGPIQLGVTQKIPTYFCSAVQTTVGGGLATAGGRVFCSIGFGKDLAHARTQAYQRLVAVRFIGMQVRTDIAGDVKEKPA
jgi:phosphoribosylamine--glycine ligase